MVVDILMCTYNGAHFIEQQIQSILNQSYTQFRLIIIDDISTDGTVDIIKKMMVTDARIEFHQNEINLGYFDNFLSGLSYVKSDYLFFSDQDDIWLENKIESQLNDLLAADESVLMNFSNSFLLFEGMDEGSHYSTKREPIKIKPYYFSPIELSLRNIVAGHTILIKTSRIPEIIESLSKITNKKGIYFDYILTLILLDYGTVKYFDQSLVYFRQHSNSTSTKMRMNYYTYLSNNAFAYAQISNSPKNVTCFSILHKVLSENANFFSYLKFLHRNLLNLNRILNNYDFFNSEKKVTFFSKMRSCFKLSYAYYAKV